MDTYKIILGSLATLISFVGYVPYFKNIFSGKTKPHAFSWLVWSVLASIAFAVQVVENAGAGSWVTGFTALVCFIIFLLALTKGDRKFTLFDWVALIIAGLSIVLWRLTHDPIISVILITLIDIFGFLPSFRKGYSKPHEETVSTFTLSSIKWIVAIVALDSFSLSTWLYPASLILTNGIFVIMLLVRRKQLR